MKLFGFIAASSVSAQFSPNVASSGTYLYCIYAGGGHNPRMLPNNMCCPFLQTEGIPGIPYHSAIHGCCETRLYDLYTQECCADTGVVLEKGSTPLSPQNVQTSLESLGGENTLMLTWDFSESGSSYLLDVTSMKNATTGADVLIEKPQGLGEVESEFHMLIGIQNDVEYTFELSTVNCLGVASAYPTVHKFTNPFNENPYGAF